MKNATALNLIIVCLVVLIGVILYVGLMPAKSPSVIVQPQTSLLGTDIRMPRRRVRRTPEFRGPPYKVYKPGKYQQMGLLVGDAGSILPLYGRETRGYRDRYNYYTNSPGQQIYPLPLSFDNRDCTEDIGCPEFYGNENVSVTGLNGENFSVKNYRNFPL